jgi:Holliday junction resolvasome RuvABC endonuclease subunit
MYQVEKMKPDLIVIETAVVASGHGVQMGVLFLHGVIRHEIYDCYGPQIPVVDLHNLSLKKFACGDQKLRDKSQVLMRALAKGGAVANEDEADAFWCMQAGVAAYERVNDQQSLPYYQQEVLSGIDWPEIQGLKPKWIKPKKSAARKKLPMTLEG